MVGLTPAEKVELEQHYRQELIDNSYRFQDTSFALFSLKQIIGNLCYDWNLRTNGCTNPERGKVELYDDKTDLVFSLEPKAWEKNLLSNTNMTIIGRHPRDQEEREVFLMPEI